MIFLESLYLPAGPEHPVQKKLLYNPVRFAKKREIRGNYPSISIKWWQRGAAPFFIMQKLCKIRQLHDSLRFQIVTVTSLIVHQGNV